MTRLRLRLGGGVLGPVRLLQTLRRRRFPLRRLVLEGDRAEIEIEGDPEAAERWLRRLVDVKEVAHEAV